MDDKQRALFELEQIANRMNDRPAMIRTARSNGAEWSEIAAALRVSRQTAINLSKK